MATAQIYTKLLAEAKEYEVIDDALPLPADDDPFDGATFIDGDYGTYSPGSADDPDHFMLMWVPEDIQERYDEGGMDRYGKTWLDLNPDQEEEIIAALTTHGYVCRKDQLSVDRVTGEADVDTGEEDAGGTYAV